MGNVLLKMRININEDTIKRVVRESINKFINEDRTEMNDGSVEIDNFENVKEVLKFTKPNDTIYFCEIIKRDKDNPGQKSQFYAAQYLKQFYFKSLDEFERAENEIKQLCKQQNARAYIYLNARSKAVIDKWTAINASRFKRNPKMAKIFGNNPMALAAGRSFDAPDRPLCFVDIDSSDFNDIKAAMKIIQDAGIKPLFAYRSLNNGLHIVLPDKEAAKKLDFSPITGDLRGLGKRAKMNAKVGVEIDKPTLLYACLKPQGYDAQYQRFARLGGKMPTKP